MCKQWRIYKVKFWTPPPPQLGSIFFNFLDPPLVILFCFTCMKFNEWFYTDFNVFVTYIEILRRCLANISFLPPISENHFTALRLWSSEIFTKCNHLSACARSPTLLNNTRPLYYLNISRHFSAANPYLFVMLYLVGSQVGNPLQKQ